MCSTENDRRFYVYVHRDAADHMFYVGKGTGDRAWRKSRDELWHRYVTERSGGKYSVEIVSDGLNEEEALELEEELIERYGDACTNWVNVRRKFDFEACERYWKLRKEAQRLTAEAAQLPPERREEAIALCHKALAL